MSDEMTERADAHSSVDGRDSSQRGRGRRLLENQRGAVFVEFLIAFLPVHVFFLCLVQVAIVFSVRLLTEHAAVNGARAAAVVFGDDEARYGGEPAHRNLAEQGERRQAVRRAVVITLMPMILSGVIQTVRVEYPRGDQLDGPKQSGPITYQAMSDHDVQKVRVRVVVEAACRIGFASQIVCPSFTARAFDFLLPTRIVRAEAIFPYQGANYRYFHGP